jgi:hypothetical protein
MAGRLNLSSFVAQNLFHRRNLAHVAMHHINTFIVTTAVNKLNCNARSARQLFNPIIALKEPLNQNTSVPIASGLYSAGNPIATSLFTNALTITASTDSTLLTNSTRLKNLYKR